MKRSSVWCLIVVGSFLCSAFAEERQILTSESASPDAFMLRDGDVLAISTAFMIAPEGTCSNCLIRRCRVVSGKLNGYCLEGARGGICHQSYDPAHCPAGKTPKSSVFKQCGPSKFLVDNLRPCS
jgi:hypothetical protein